MGGDGSVERKSVPNISVFLGVFNIGTKTLLQHRCLHHYCLKSLAGLKLIRYLYIIIHLIFQLTSIF